MNLSPRQLAILAYVLDHPGSTKDQICTGVPAELVCPICEVPLQDEDDAIFWPDKEPQRLAHRACAEAKPSAAS